ncbi:MotA/TolQ/ExbB proton channel family protein [Pseudomonas sp. F1_0610]|uniref:MotA/TolQ/ExbB proton channel family protein n=1 Tax=Pseudomonas sp. F1_0610 TaxID=3114284 RepID=UPI0039C3F509
MKRLLIASALALATLASAQAEVLTPDQLLQRIRSEKVAEEQAMQQREQSFLSDRNQQSSVLAKAQAELKAQETEAATLKAQFEENEKILAEQEKLLKERTGALGELFTVVRQSAGDVAGQWQSSLLNVQYPERIAQLEKLSASRKLPTAEQVEGYWMTLLEDLAASGRVEKFSAPVVGKDGQRTQQDVWRVGPFSAYSNQAFLSYAEGSDAFSILNKQPEGFSQVAHWQQANTDLSALLVDPTRGSLIEQLQREPTFFERVQQGGFVGWVILTLGALGILFALWRMTYLATVTAKVRAQMRNLAAPKDNNPLGRVIGVFGSNPTVNDIETLELKLDEAVMREVPKLEGGQGLLKLIAAVAPLLGLLGTVTGMIITFQAITQSGGGDSRLMADGISQALVTTVQGLVVAIPMLFLHSLVASRCKALVQLLEQQCVGLLSLQITGKKPRDE